MAQIIGGLPESSALLDRLTIGQRNLAGSRDGNELGTAPALAGARRLRHALPCTPLPAWTCPYPGQGRTGAFL